MPKRILIFLRPRTFSHEFLHDKKQETEYNYAIISVGSSGGGGGGGRKWNPPHIKPDACLRLKFLHRPDRISPFNWLIFFLMKRASHFATKLNSRDIKKGNCFRVPSYNLDPSPQSKMPGIAPAMYSYSLLYSLTN